MDCDYEIEGAPWRVECGEELCSRFGLAAADLQIFHRWFFGRSDLKVALVITRLLFGWSPVIPAEGSDPDYFNTDWAIPSIANKLNTTPDSCQLELDMACRCWKKYQASLVVSPKPEPKVEEPAKPPTLVEYSDDPPTPEQVALLKKHGFDVSDFEVESSLKDKKKRPEAKKFQEIQWMCGRLRDNERALNDGVGKSRMRAILINELAVRRIDERVMKLSADDPTIDRMAERKDSIEKILIQQWAEITKVCPYIQQQVSKVVAILSISEMIEGLREFRANRDNSLIDGIFTASEILVMDRESVQQTSKYRPGWVAAMIEANSGLFDPSFKSKMPIAFCQTLDMAHLLAKKTINEKLHIQIPNLLDDGPAGEYPDLPELSESVTVDLAEETGKISLDDELIAAPLKPVPMEGDADGQSEPSVAGRSAA